MCDKNSNLNKAILAQVQSFTTNNQKFSVHDVTVALRKDANSGNLNLPEFETPNGQYKYNIPHVSVKSAFTELLADGIFTEINLQLNRSHNGVYFEYDAVPITSTTAVPICTPAVVCVPVATSIPSNQLIGTGRVDYHHVIVKVSNYLDNHVGQDVTIEEIRAAIKCNGWHCNEIKDIVVQQVSSTQLSIDNDYPSKSVVHL